MLRRCLYLTLLDPIAVALLAIIDALSTAILLRNNETSFLVILSSSRIFSTLLFTSSAFTFNKEQKQKGNIYKKEKKHQY